MVSKKLLYFFFIILSLEYESSHEILVFICICEQ